MTENWGNNAQQAGTENRNSSPADEKKEQGCCGRSYNEESDFSQINFATYQNILDKRNELLSSVKPQSLL